MSLDARVVVRRASFAVDVSLDVPAGRVAAVVGPNGAGKTTLLRALAGLERLDEGRVVLGDRTLDDAAADLAVAPEDRRVGLVPQGSLVFPHLDAAGNVAYGLRCRGRAHAEAKEASVGWLERVGLADRVAAPGATLSGGEAQRVALARALAVEPDLLLLDEPLSAVDAPSRPALRTLLRELLGDFAGVTVVVTHDVLDAVVLADDLVVMADGRMVEAGPVTEVTARPRTDFVADLVGTNLLAGVATGTTVALEAGGALVVADPMEGPVFVSVAPHAVSLHRARPETSARNVWEATVGELHPAGTRVEVRLTGSRPLRAEVTAAAAAELELAEGRPVWASLKATDPAVYARR